MDRATALDKELFDGLMKEATDTIKRLIKERDEALTEIQELHQKTYDDLAAAQAEVERLKAQLRI